MRRHIHHMILSTLIVGVSGCAMTRYLRGDSQPEAEKSTGAEKDESQNVELKMAKMNAKIEELEQSVREHKERQMLLEKTLMLGIVPDDLREPGKIKREKVRNPLGTDGFEAGESAVAAAPAPLLPQPIETLNEDQRRVYESELAKAQAEFNSGKYGESIVSYEAIGKRYSPAVTLGNERYWVGVSWYYLKDYVSAKKHLDNFGAQSPKSALLPRSKLYLALCERDQGLVRQAQGRLKALLDEYPDSDVTESAQFELKKLEERL